MEIVRKIAAVIYRSLPPGAIVSPRDLEQDGVIGLMEALARFDPGRGVKFASFAGHRVHGVIMDGLRRLDFLPRLAEQRYKMVERARVQLLQELGHPASDRELARRLNGRAAEIMKDGANVPRTGSLSHRLFDNDRGAFTEQDQIADRAAPRPDRCAMRKDLREFLCRGMTREERLIFVCYYFENCTMKEAGAAIGLSECRVSQIISALMARLRSRVDLQKLVNARDGRPGAAMDVLPSERNESIRCLLNDGQPTKPRGGRNSKYYTPRRQQGRAAEAREGARRQGSAERGGPARQAEPTRPAQDGRTTANRNPGRTPGAPAVFTGAKPQKGGRETNQNDATPSGPDDLHPQQGRRRPKP